MRPSRALLAACSSMILAAATAVVVAQTAAPAPSGPAKMPAWLGDKPLGSLMPPGDWKKNWTADNGNGTYSNPLFNEEFEDPDPIRVGDDYYLAGTTMHMMPAVIVMHSKDLVNWELASYCMDKLDLGPAYRMEGGNIYGRGIWAPCMRYHDGMFYVFSNVNGAQLQVFRSKSANGPWEHNTLPGRHDLSVLFDDDGKVYIISGSGAPYPIEELNPDIRSFKADAPRRQLAPQGGRMGEGHHLYKAKGKYYDVSAIPGGAVNQVVAKADSIDGPWTVTTMCEGESLGVSANPPRTSPSDRGVWIHQGGMCDTPTGEWWSVIMSDHGSGGRMVNLVPITWDNEFPLIGVPGNLRKAPNTWVKPNTGVKQDPKPAFVHDDTFEGQYLNPTWQWNHVQDDSKWSITEKPGVLRLHSLAAANFYNARNTLSMRPPAPESIMTVELDTSGMTAGDTAGLGLVSTPYAWIGVAKTETGTALQFVSAAGGGRGGGGGGGGGNRGGAGGRGRGTAPAGGPAGGAMGPMLDYQLFLAAAPAGGGAGGAPGAGGRGAGRGGGGGGGGAAPTPVIGAENPPAHVWLRVHCNFDTDQAIFSWSADGKEFKTVGTPFTTTFQLTTFQGVRPGLFSYNAAGQPGGYADFDNFTVDEPRARGIEREVPAGKTIVLTSGADGSFLAADNGKLVTVAAGGAAPANVKFQVVDVGLGRVALKAADGKVVSVAAPDSVVLKDLAGGKPGDAESFQWVNLLRGDTMLMVQTNHQYLATKPNSPGPVTANGLGATAARKSGAEFKWKEAN
jgi:beta-xylosidase